MKKLDKILTQNGLDWSFKDKTKEYEAIHQMMQRTVEKYHYKKFTVEEGKNLIKLMVQNMFSSTECHISINNKQLFVEKNGSTPCVNIVPEVLLKEIGYYYFLEEDQLKKEIEFPFYQVNRWAIEREQEKYKPLFDYLEQIRSDEQKIKMMFDEKTGERVLREEIRELIDGIRKEVLGGKVMESLEKELYEFFYDWLAKKIRKTKAEEWK